MTAATLHTWGVLVPYTLIATAAWGLGAGAVKDAVRVGSLRARVGRVPTVPLAYAVGLVAFAFIYACVLDRFAMRAALGADPHAGHGLGVLWFLSATSWLSVTVLAGGYGFLRRGTHAILSRSARAADAEARADEAEATLEDAGRAAAIAFARGSENIGIGVGVYDLRSSRYLAANRVFRTIYGDGNPDGPDGLFEREYFDFLRPEDRPFARELNAQRLEAILAGEPDPGYEGVRLHLANGRVIEFHQAERRGDPGNVIGILQVRDATAEVRAREAEERRHAEEVLNARIDARRALLR